jgi:hypothetical protein
MSLSNSGEKGLASDKSPESQNWANLLVSYQGNKTPVPADNIYTLCKHQNTLHNLHHNSIKHQFQGDTLSEEQETICSK